MLKTLTPAAIHHRLQAVYGENTVNRTTVNRWAIKFRECEPGRANIVDRPRSGRPVSTTDDKHQKQVDDLAPSDFHFFPHLKRDLKGTRFASDDEVKQAVTSWIKQRTPEFFIDGMCKLVLGWKKFIE